MSRRRFHVPRDSIRDGVAVLPPSQAHHLRNVLRMGSGDIVEMFDGEGNGFIGTVEMRGTDVLIRDLKSIPFPELPVVLTLAAALVKPAKFEWMLQKTTELGIEEIIPLKTRFSEIQIPDSKIDSRLERWTRIVHEASKQCGRFAAPQVLRPIGFQELLGIEKLAGCTKFLFYEKAGVFWRPEQIPLSARIVLCIGPEGGWDRDEIEQAAKAGYQISSLGRLILRAETAAIAAVSIIQHHIRLSLESPHGSAGVSPAHFHAL
jgi:16S rRNA (uracil1498-N3)-methyltransferase